MNERIKELAEQAGFQYIKDERIGWAGNYNASLPKFAELIIIHCASQVRFTDLLLCNDDSDGEILLQASVQLKRHFGVEE
jgi:hypothetical protein